MDHSTLSTVPVSELVFMGIMAAAGACCCLCTVVGIFAYIMHRQAIAHREVCVDVCIDEQYTLC